MKKIVVTATILGFLVAGVGCQQAGNVGNLQNQVNQLANRVAQLEKEIAELKVQVTKLTQEEMEEGEETEAYEHGQKKGITTKAGTHRPPARKKTK